MKPQSNQSKIKHGVISVRFMLAKPQNALSSLECIISINNDRASEFVIEKKIKTVNWAQKLQKMLDDSEESMLINQKLDLVRNEIRKAEIRLRLEGKKLSAKALKTEYLQNQGVQSANVSKHDQPKRPTYQDCFLAFYGFKSTQKRKPVCDRTRQSYWRYRNNLEKYLEEQKIKKLYADTINYDWAEKYLNWLLDRFQNDYANNNIKSLKSVLQHAENKHIIEKNGLKGYRLFDDNEYDTTHLTIEEIQRISNTNFSAVPSLSEETADALKQEADCFVFSCFTGQHHQDLLRKSLEVYTNSIDGRTWIRDRRVKTKVKYNVPLHPIAQKILEKYGSIENLPVKGNAKRNIRLQSIALVCGISKKITTKTGRKTFANFCLNTLRMREETVAALLGQRSTKYLKNYARITEESISAEFRW